MMDDQGKNTDTTNNFEYLLLFHGNDGYANVPRCYIICILPFLLRKKKPAMPSTTEVYGKRISQSGKYKSCSLHKQKDNLQNYKVLGFILA